jgi:predicted oxidoreductase
MEKVFAENRLILGLMRLKDLTPEDLAKVIEGCLEKGIHYFDISDIYCRHACEEKLGIALRTHPELRPQMFIQTKCGIVKEEGVFPHYDLSYDHILEAVDGSLARMNLTYVDSLLLHRPDIFLDAEEVGKAFIRLHDEGKECMETTRRLHSL